MVGLVPGDEVLAVLIGNEVFGRAGLDLGFNGTERGGGFEDKVVVGVRVGVEREGQLLVDDGGALGRVAGLEHLAEADKGVHLVEVAADLGFEADELGDVVVGFDLEEVAVSLETIEDAIEEVPALWIAVDGGELGGFEEGFWDVGVLDGSAVGCVVKGEGKGERRRDGAVLEVEVLGAIAGFEGVASGGAPGVEIGLKKEVFHAGLSLRWRESRLGWPLGFLGQDLHSL